LFSYKLERNQIADASADFARALTIFWLRH